MRVYFEEEGDNRLPLNCAALAERVGEAVLDYEECPYEAQIELLVTNNEEIRELNKEYREIDHSTDVLSFPLVDFETPSDFDMLEERDDLFEPDLGELMLGNIVISKETCIAQAEEYGHSIEREFAFLVAHSMLHLLGYDHMEDEEREVMEKKQREILDKMGITR